MRTDAVEVTIYNTAAAHTSMMFLSMKYAIILRIKIYKKNDIRRVVSRSLHKIFRKEI